MRLFLYLFLGQLVGDFLLQSSELVRLKRLKMYGLYPHVGLVAVATAAAIWGSIPVPHALILLGLVAAFHLLLDRLSILAFSKTDARQVFIFMADQVAHIAVLAGMAWVFTLYGQTPVGRSWAVPLSDAWLTLLCGVLAVAFGGAVFLFEVVEAVAPSDPKRAEGSLMGYSVARVVGMVERAALYLSVVTGFYLPSIVLLVARGIWTATRTGDERTRTIAESVATVLVVAVIAAVTVGIRAQFDISI